MKLGNWLPSVVVVVLVAGAIIWFNQENRPRSALTPDRTRACHALQGDPNDRVAACYAELGVSPLSDGASELLTKLGNEGKLFAVGARLGSDHEVIRVQDHPDVQTALMDREGATVARQLRDLGVRGLVVHRDLTGAVDRDSSVLARLAHHDHLLWFQLRHVTEELMIYTVRPSPAKLTIETGDSLLQGLRARLEGQPPSSWPRSSFKPDALRAIATMRLQGKTLAIRHAIHAKEGRDVNVTEMVLDELADKLVREWERQVEPDGHGTLPDRLDDVRLEIHVVMERAVVEPRSRFAIFDLWEMGVDGVMFRQRAPAAGEQLDEKFTYIARL